MFDRDLLGDDMPDPAERAARRKAFIDREMANLVRDVDPLGGGIAGYREGLRRSNEWWDAVRSFADAERISDREVVIGLLRGEFGIEPHGLRRAAFTAGDHHHPT